MIDIHSWLEIFSGRLEERFHGRVWFSGLQGSYARGEAKETSDIDVVVILDTLSFGDLKSYHEMLDGLPEREKVCGFVSGRDELLNWETSDLLQFCYDTVPITGSLDEILALVDRAAVKRAVKIGACNIYHACVHNFLHERDGGILTGLYKSAVFVIQTEYFLMTGQYIRSHSGLFGHVSAEERRILSPEAAGFDELSRILFTWAGQTLRRNHDEA
ncbi:MAG: nucleotidyltransferase domain-containing protein [Synergistaceae bacterium]|nr:nucleotidyltransferase domain-containing protein [Synergistaceae bacterium]